MRNRIFPTAVQGRNLLAVATPGIDTTTLRSLFPDPVFLVSSSVLWFLRQHGGFDTAILQPNAWRVASSVDVGGKSEEMKQRIRTVRRTFADVGGRFANRIHTHEVAGSSPAPP